MPQDAFSKRIQMIEAADRGDFTLVNDLLAEDVRLEAFGVYMNRQVALGRMDIVQRTLELPSLDKTSAYFQQCISTLIVAAAYQQKADILDLLITYTNNPQEDSTRALRHLFNCSVVESTSNPPSPQIANILLRYGADERVAYDAEEGRLLGEQAAIERKLKDLRQYKAKIHAAQP